MNVYSNNIYKNKKKIKKENQNGITTSDVGSKDKTQLMKYKYYTRVVQNFSLKRYLL